MVGFKGCINGVCSWEGTKYLNTVSVPGSLLESLTLRKAAEAAATSEAMRSGYSTAYKAVSAPPLHVPATTKTIVISDGTRNDPFMVTLLSGIAVGIVGIGLAIAYRKAFVIYSMQATFKERSSNEEFARESDGFMAPYGCD